MLNTDNGTGVMYRKWVSDTPRAVLLLVHGLGAHSARWESLGSFLLSRGISSYALELRGFGETKDAQGYVDSFTVYFRDIQALRGIIGREIPGTKIFITGESMGALLAFESAVLFPQSFAGLVCMSLPLKNRLKLSAVKYALIYISLFLNPGKPFTMPFNAAMCTRDPAYQKVMEADIREHRLATPKLLWEILKSERRLQGLKDKVGIPSLFLFAGRDEFIEVRAGKDFYESLTSSDKEIIEYPDMYHAISVDIGKEQVFGDMLKWIEKRIN